MSITLFGSPEKGAFRLPYQGLYSDGTPLIKVDEDLTQFNTMLVKPGGLMEFVNAMFLVDSIGVQGGRITKLVLPYVPGARQDRVNIGGDILTTARSVAGMINDRHFESVIIADPHSPVITRAIINVKVFPLTMIYDRLWKGYTGVCSADKGGVARATAAAEIIGRDMAYGSKHRDEKTGKLTGFSVDGIKWGGHYLVADDICDGGGTFVGLGEKIREAGAYCDLFVTHGLFSKGTSSLHEVFKNVYTTDTVDSTARQNHEVMTINIVKDMVNYV